MPYALSQLLVFTMLEIGWNLVRKPSLPPLHVALNLEQVLKINSPWLCRGSLQHESSEFGVEMRWLSTGPTSRQYLV